MNILDELIGEHFHANPWMGRAACQFADPELFHPERGGSVTEAKRICGGCPVKQECLDYALENDERHGVWGQPSERERYRMRREAA